MENRVGQAQLETLLDYLQHHPSMVKGVVLGVRPKETVDRQWNELATQLNSHGSGAKKTGQRWKRYWIDLKYKVKSRAVQRRRDAVGTGGVLSGQPDLSEIEKKVLDIISGKEVFGDVKNQVQTFNPEPSSGIQNHSLKVFMLPLDTSIDSTIIESPSGDITSGKGESSDNSDEFAVIQQPTSSASTEKPLSLPRKDSPISNPPLPPSKRPRLQRSVPLKSRQITKVDSAWVIELERKRVAAEEQMANANMIAAEAAKMQAEVALLQAQNHDKLIEILQKQNEMLLELIKKKH